MNSKNTQITHQSQKSECVLVGCLKLFFRKPLILKHAQWTSYHSWAACPPLQCHPQGGSVSEWTHTHNGGCALIHQVAQRNTSA